MTSPSVKPVFEVKLHRQIAAPAAKVFQAWKQPNAVSEWFAPKPFKLIVHELDLRTGGRFKMAMRSPEGQEFPFSGNYDEIVENQKIAWSGRFSGEGEDQLATLVTFTDLGGKTVVTAEQRFFVMTPEIEQATKGAEQGWTMTLNQLAEYCEQG